MQLCSLNIITTTPGSQKFKLCVNSFENNNYLIHRHQVETTSHNMTVKRKMFNQRNRVMVLDSQTGLGQRFISPGASLQIKLHRKTIQELLFHSFISRSSPLTQLSTKFFSALTQESCFTLRNNMNFILWSVWQSNTEPVLSLLWCWDFVISKAQGNSLGLIRFFKLILRSADWRPHTFTKFEVDVYQ